MALFQRNNPQINTTKPFFTISQNKTLLLVGLGNVGQGYIRTRHNVGFVCINYFVEQHQEAANWIEKKDLKSLFSIGSFGETRVIAIKPTTLMNLSGEAVEATMNFYKIPPANVLIIHDELDIDFGKVRTGKAISDAGHNGIKSIIDKTDNKFSRIRIGIGPRPEKIDASDFVLSKFSNDQLELMNNLCKEVDSLLIEYIYSSELPLGDRSFLI